MQSGFHFLNENGLSTVLLQCLCLTSGTKQNKNDIYFLLILRPEHALENFHI